MWAGLSESTEMIPRAAETVKDEIISQCQEACGAWSRSGHTPAETGMDRDRRLNASACAMAVREATVG